MGATNGFSKASWGVYTDFQEAVEKQFDYQGLNIQHKEKVCRVIMSGFWQSWIEGKRYETEKPTWAMLFHRHRHQCQPTQPCLPDNWVPSAGHNATSIRPLRPLLYVCSLSNLLDYDYCCTLSNPCAPDYLYQLSDLWQLLPTDGPFLLLASLPGKLAYKCTIFSFS
jgi:hypothetical protein